MEEKEILDTFPGTCEEASLEELESDEDFKCFAAGMRENESVASVYGRYLALVDRIKKEERERVIAAYANKMASVGALSTAEPPEEVFFTREQVKAMSAAEIKKNYEKIRKSQKKWR